MLYDNEMSVSNISASHAEIPARAAGMHSELHIVDINPTAPQTHSHTIQPQRLSKAMQQLSFQATLFTLVRHGETDWNLEHRLQGQLQPGPSLNTTGQQQAVMVCQHCVHIISASHLAT